MKVITLVENESLNDNFQSEHGLSLYIETENHKIIFDTGKTDLFIKNAQKLNIDLKEVDIVVISHGHYDHIGGLLYFFNINKKAKVYLKKEIFDYQYLSLKNEYRKKIGYPESLRTFFDRFIFMQTSVYVIDNLYFISTIDKNYPLPKANKILFTEKTNIIKNDTFSHELIFAIRTNNQLVVFSGCAHRGILNTITTVKRILPLLSINSVIGGFHLVDDGDNIKTETEAEIIKIGNLLNQFKPTINYYTGHCTGKVAFKILSKILGDNLQKISSGSVLNFDENNFC